MVFGDLGLGSRITGEPRYASCRTRRTCTSPASGIAVAQHVEVVSARFRVYSPHHVDRIWGIWESCYNIPTAIFYLLRWTVGFRGRLHKSGQPNIPNS